MRALVYIDVKQMNKLFTMCRVDIMKKFHELIKFDILKGDWVSCEGLVRRDLLLVGCLRAPSQQQ